MVDAVTFEQKHCPCGAAIIWASTKTNKAMPVDFEITENGNVYVSERPGREPLAEVMGASSLDAHPGQLRLSHFATCPKAERFRKVARRGRPR